MPLDVKYQKMVIEFIAHVVKVILEKNVKVVLVVFMEDQLLKVNFVNRVNALETLIQMKKVLAIQ